MTATPSGFTRRSIEAGKVGDPEAAVKRFREDPESSLAENEVRVHARGADLRWA